MGKPKFSLMDKTLNPEIVDGKRMLLSKYLMAYRYGFHIRSERMVTAG